MRSDCNGGGRWIALDDPANRFIIQGVAPDCVGKVDLVPSLKPLMEEEGI